jgi:hypothetical protein
MATGHHTKDKGDVAVAKVQADLVERGAMVLQPFTEHAPFDLVAYINETFYRVQVKFRTAQRGCVEVRFRSTWADRHGVHSRPMAVNEIDVIAIYCPDTCKAYYLNPRDFALSATVRIAPSRNGQALRVLQAASCLAFPPATSVGARVQLASASDVA